MRHALWGVSVTGCAVVAVKVSEVGNKGDDFNYLGLETSISLSSWESNGNFSSGTLMI